MKLRDQLEAQDLIHIEVGKAIHQWGHLDRTLFTGFCMLTEIEDYDLARLLFYRTTGTPQRANLVGDVLALRCSGLAAEWRKLNGKIGKLLKERNAFAHNPIEYHSAIAARPSQEDGNFADVFYNVKLGIPRSTRTHEKRFADVSLIDAAAIKRHTSHVFALGSPLRRLFAKAEAVIENGVASAQ